MGLSWVAVWVLMFAVVVPNRPRQTAIATLASVSAVMPRATTLYR
ncbi:MAG TPA: hypothetical protein VFX92_10670 [Candidatus Krumholzibacteria bacterium]|nr:hypothetical protein [Candidatus Krumholzibacteria bacterium]